MLTHGELFAGISGFGLGFAQSGIETLWHVEIDKHCQNILRRHYPDTLLLGDVRECGAHNLPPVDIISFGSPCQDLSIAGKRKGLNGERSGLFFEAIRIVRELHPTYAIWENVPGALSSNGGRDFGAVLDALAESGALDIGWAILDAQWFGVAQRRRRVFVVADFRGRRSAEILSIPEGRKGDIAPSTSERQGVAAAIVERIGKGGFTDPVNDNIIPLYYTHDYNQDRIYSADGISPAHTATDNNRTRWIAYTIQQNDGGDHKRSDRPNGGMYVKEAEQALTVGSTDQTVVTSQQPDVTILGDGRLGRSTLPQGRTTEVYSTLYGVRRLTPTECERLQGFPDNWTRMGAASDMGEKQRDLPWHEQSDSARYRQLGNAVCVAVTIWLGKRIVEAHNSDT